MHDVQLAQDGRSVGGEDHFLQMVDNNLVAAVGAERGLHSLGDGLAGFDVADDGAIFSVVAGPLACMLAIWSVLSIETVTYLW